MTKEELRAKYPDEIAQVEADARASVDHTEAVNTAIQAERARMQEIDEISGLLDATDVQQAKYGDKPCSAADLLMAAAKNAAKQGKKFLTDLKDDSEESGAEGVPAAPAPAVETPEGEDGEKNDTPEARMTNARSMVADLLGRRRRAKNMINLSEKLGEMTFDGLITDIKPAPEVRGGVIRKLSAAATLKRGTILAKSSGTAGDGKLVVLGSTAKENETLTPDCILCDDIDVGTAADEKVAVYTAGCFDIGKVTVSASYTITEGDKDNLRMRGIVFKAAAAAN